MITVLDVAARIAFGLAGLSIVLLTILSAVRTFVLPRSANTWLTRTVFNIIRKIFDVRLRRAQAYEDRDRIMAMYAPIGLLCLPLTWLALIMIGYTLIYMAVTEMTLYEAWKVSGSSLLTLGFALSDSTQTLILEFSEAAVGIIMSALLISYLPTIYSAFQRRETLVNLLEVRAGDPPDAVTLLTRVNRIQGLSSLHDMWEKWELWFADIEESHTSLSALVFFRSPKPGRSWVTAAGAVLDAAALTRSTVDIPVDAQADLCIRAGFLALRHIADFFDVEYDPDPKSGDPISVTREEFDSIYDTLLVNSVPLKIDRDQCWKDYSGWRVNYDRVLIALGAMTLAPYAPRSTDRSIPRSMMYRQRGNLRTGTFGLTRGTQSIKSQVKVPLSNEDYDPGSYNPD